jgi:hypothetical protein
LGASSRNRGSPDDAEVCELATGRRDRRLAKRRISKLRDISFAVILFIAPFLAPWGNEVPVIPYGLLSLLAALGFTIHLFWTWGRVEGWSRTRKIGVVLCTTYLLANFLRIPLREKWKGQQAEKTDGYISSLHTGLAKGAIFEIGDSDSKFECIGDKSKPAWQFVYDSGLLIVVENGELKISTPVKDRDGRLIAKIDRNHWYVYSGALDKNYNTNSLEVIDAGGHVVLQVKLLNDRIQIQGEWRDEFGNGVRMRKTNIDAGEQKGAMFVPWRNPQTELKFDSELIKPMFKYPSRDHWGELSGH